MVFSSLIFLFLFLPLVLAAYCLCPARFRNVLLLVVSLVFYAWGEPRYILIMVFSTVFDYMNGRLLEWFEGRKPSMRKVVLVISVVGNLGILCFFKYTDFLLQTISGLTGMGIELLGIALPVGISFYTFQTMSYTIDVYRGKVKAQHDLIAFGMYVSMFPQLIAGPIVRYSTVEKQIYQRRLCSEDMAEGMQRFLMGLGKKVLLANQMGDLWNEISGMPELSVLGAWLGAVAYTFQIYFDFSGYSDMAIGLGRIFGFTFPENFRYPYESRSITEFWRRWHITLGTWFREYLYVPLGGNRKGIRRQVLNLFLVWFLTGLWHGADWNFILWGLYFFVLLLAEKMFLLRRLEEFRDWVQHLYALFFIVLGWVLFACTDLGQLTEYLRAMFGFGAGIWDKTAVYQWYTHLPLLVILAIAATEKPKLWVKCLWQRLLKPHPWYAANYGKQTEFLFISIYSAVILVLSIAFLVSGSYNPFLYFRF